MGIEPAPRPLPARTLAIIENAAALQFAPADIATLAEVAVGALTGGDALATAAYNRGRLAAETDVRDKLLAMAKKGNVAAQKMLLDIIESNAARLAALRRDPDAGTQGRRQIENQALTDLVGAIDAHLEPLKLSEDLQDTDADLIRLAAEEITRLRAKRKRPQRRRSHGEQDVRKQGKDKA